MKNTKELKQGQEGITLIALVITIIVLLILAGVSIAMLTGNNGILTQANKAKTLTTNKSAEEKVKLAIMAAKSQSEDANLDLEKLKTEVTTNYGGQVDGGAFPAKVTIDGKSFTVASEGNVEFKENKKPGTVTIIDGNGKNIGDKIAITSTKGTEEKFYVLSYNESTQKAKALAEWNLMVGGIYADNDSDDNKIEDVNINAAKYGLQDEAMKGLVRGQEKKGTVKFSSSKYWDDTYTPQGSSSYPWVYNNKSNLYQYLEAYKTLLGNTSKVSEVSLASFEDINALWPNKSKYPWLCNTTFWLGSTAGTSSTYVWFVYANGGRDSGYFNYSCYYGVRPAITIDMSKI